MGEALLGKKTAENRFLQVPTSDRRCFEVRMLKALTWPWPVLYVLISGRV